jgi:antitoxin HigA-1
VLKPASAIDQPPHPGEILREDILPQTGLAHADLARRLGISVATLGAVIEEQVPVTLDLAHRLASAVGQSAKYWLGLQMQFDLWQTGSRA